MIDIKVYANCNGILKNDKVLPLAFEPNAAPCMLCDSVQTVLTAFNARFPVIDTTRDDYEQIFANNKLVVDVLGIGTDTTQRGATAASVLNVSSFLPLQQWTHCVVKRTGDPASPVQIMINGYPVALDYTVNDLDRAVRLAGTGSFMVGSHNAPHLTVPGKLQGTIKNLRVYNRLLSASEIRQNTYNYCQTPGQGYWIVVLERHEQCDQ